MAVRFTLRDRGAWNEVWKIHLPLESAVALTIPPGGGESWYTHNHAVESDGKTVNMQPNPPKKQNPWQLLVIGGFFLLGGISCLFQKGDAVVYHTNIPGRYSSGASWVELVTPERAQLYGSIYSLIALICFVLYWQIRRNR